MKTEFDRLVENLEALKSESESLQGYLDLARAEKMLLLSESVSAGLQAFLFKMQKMKPGNKAITARFTGRIIKCSAPRATNVN